MMWNVYQGKQRKVMLAALAVSCLTAGGYQGYAANLAAAVASDYANSQMGAVTGSRVTTKVDSALQAGAVKDLNGDPATFAVNINGKTDIFLRQYTYSTDNLKKSKLLTAQGDWNSAVNPTGNITSVPNAHAASSFGDFLYATGYDLGKIGIAEVKGSEISEKAANAVDLKADILKYTGNTYDDKVTVHGEGLLADQGSLYVVASVNLTGDYYNYDPSYLMQYKVNSDGTLTYQSYTRLGKNTDVPRLNHYNDKFLVSAIGGYQNYGSGNPETSIDVGTINLGTLEKESQKITKPNYVPYDFRDLKVLPNGTVYIMTYNISSSASGIDTTIYKTTLSNLLSAHPDQWESIISGNKDGWFGKIDAEYYTKRLWVEFGNNLLVYTDGAAEPTAQWETKDFSTNSQYYQFNSLTILPSDTVWGSLAQLSTYEAEGLTKPSEVSSVTINGNATMAAPTRNSQITGTETDHDAYGDITSDYSRYVFDQDEVINQGVTQEGDHTTNVRADIFARDGQDISVDSGTHTLHLQSKNLTATPVGIYAGNGKSVTVTAGKINVITSGYEGGNTLTNAIWNDAGKDKGSQITLNGDVNLSMNGGYGGNGIAVQKTDRWGEDSHSAAEASTVTVNGNISILGTDSSTWGIPVNGENVYSRFNNAGILVSADKGQVNVNGDLDFAVYGNGIAVNAADSRVTAEGAHITVPSGMKYGYYTLGAYQGTIDINTGDNGASAGIHEVQLDGDLFALKTGSIHAALTTKNSYLHGIADNGGTVDLWLQNGAQWINEARNTRYADDNEDTGSSGASHVTHLYGGASAENSGVLYPKDSSDVTIDNYSGYTKVLYDHDGTDPSVISGGAVRIGAAASGSSIDMVTDYDENMSSGDAQDKVLNALAQKLYYTAYLSGEKNLKGTAVIAEGLTASSVSKYSGDISFGDTDGRGTYSGSTPIPSDGQTSAEFAKGITGGTDADYTAANVKKDLVYTFTKDSQIKVSTNALNPGYGTKVQINGEGHTLTFDSRGSGAVNGVLLSSSNSGADITADRIVIHAVNDNTGFISKSYGIWQSGDKSNFSISGMTDIHSDASGASYGVFASAGTTSLGGLHVDVSQKASDARSLYADGNSHVSVNMKDGKADTQEVQIQGNLYTSAHTTDYASSTKSGTLDLALTTDQSFLHGLSVYQYADNSDDYDTDITNHGTVNLYLSNGAVWTNETYGKTDSITGFTGSYLSSLSGGSAGSQGVIFQKDSRSVTIDKYSGYTRVFYNHDGTDPSVISGGSVKIGSAAAESSIDMVTDYDEHMSSGDVQDKVLNALAQKLYYTAYLSGEKNLKGTAVIAEGLTVSSASKYSGDISFSNTDGQGSYSAGEPNPPAGQTTVDFHTTLTGTESGDSEYTSGGVGKEGVYVFTKDSTISADDDDVTKSDVGYHPAVAGILGMGHDISIDASGKKLSVSAENTGSSSQSAGLYANQKMDITADSLQVSSTSSGNNAVGVWAHNGGKITVNGDLSVNTKHTSDGTAYGIYLYQGGSAVTVNGDLSMAGSGEEESYGVSSAQKGGYGTPSYQAAGIYMYDSQGAAFTVSGKADIAVRGTGVDMRGSDNNLVVLDSGRLVTPDSTEDEFKAVSAGKGIFSMGMNSAGTGANGKDVTIRGEIYTSGGIVNVGLGSKNSSFTGNVSRSSYGDGAVNLYVSNGGTWNNQTISKMSSFDGSHVSLLSGGSALYTQGYIRQGDSQPLTIDRYSGYTSVWYDHDANDPTAIKGGDVTISKADTGSQITLRTDNTGLNLSGTSAASQNLVSETLNALAKKLYYTAYSTGERNLTGKVEIAEGLTSSYASRSESITYQDSGQGSYVYTPVTEDPYAPITSAVVLSEDKIVKASEGNVQGPSSSYLVSGLYSAVTTNKQNPMTVDLNGHDLNIQVSGDKNILAGIYAGTNEYIDIVNSGEKKTVTVSASHATDTRGSNGIYAGGNSHLHIAGPVVIDGVFTKGDSVSGINIQGAGSAGGNTGSEVIIDGPLTIKNVTAQRGRGNGINASGIRVTSDSSKVTVNGDVDIDGIQGSGLYTIGADTEISVGGGSISAAADANHSKQYFAARVDKGIININMSSGEPGTSALQMKGDLYTTKEYGQKVVEYSGGELVDFSNAGVMNVALVTADSAWTGAQTYIIDKSDYGTGGYTAHDSGVFNLWLKNGAQWTNEVQSSTSDGLQSFTGSKVSALRSGTDSASQGYIYQKDSRDISIEQYSGYTTVFYQHDQLNPASITGGSVKIGKADSGSYMTLLTDSEGIKMDSEDSIDSVLNALAQKLYYTAYVTGERNLSGSVKIAEGLTASSAVMQTGDISFSDTDGQGSLKDGSVTPGAQYPDSQTTDTFTAAITGDTSADKVYLQSGVLKKDTGIYEFTKDTTINADKQLIAAGAWMGKLSAAVSSGTEVAKDTVVDMNGHALHISTTTDTTTTGITAIGKGQHVEIQNAGPIDVYAQSTKGGQTAGLFVNGGGEITIYNGGENADQKVLTVRGDTTAKANGALIKGMNGANGAQSKIVIDGLVDVLADGDVTDGKGANEAVSAVASQIDIGGGSIRAVNGAWAAIRAYGEFVSQNYGIVNVNTVKDADGNVTGAGQNKTVVEGDIVTNGGMGTKGRVSVGLSTADSHWIGNYTDNTGYGVTPGQLGNVNLFMSGGANWTGYSTGTMNVQMTGGSTWNGYNTSDQFVLGLSDGAVWYNTNSSDKDSKVGYLTGGQDGRSAGIVDMTQGSSAVDIAQYSGDTTFIYKHTAGDNYTAAVSGGNVTIGNAAAGSHVTLLTDSDGVLMNDEDSIDSVLNALAQKLYYTAYVTGERNLSGSVKIAEGLTASSAVMQTGDISFSDTDGQGSLKDGSVTPGAQYPDSQTTDIFTAAITGDTHGDKIYLQSGVLKDDVYTFTKNPTRITTSDVNGTADGQNLSAGISASGYDVTVNGTGMSLAMAGTSDDHTMGAGIYATSGRTVHVTADTVDLAPAGTGTSVGILSDGAVTITGKATITADSGIRAAGQGSVTISGTSDITAKGLAVQSDSGAVVSLKDGTVQGGLKANGGTITVNKEKDGTKVAMTGNIESTNGGLIDLTLNTSDSFLMGGILHESGNVTLNLSHGALWTDTDEIPLSRMLAVSSSGIFTLNGGDTEADAGYIMKKGTSDLKIDSYAGHTVVLYGHTGDGSSLSDYGAGNTVIEKAQSGSGIILATDSEGVDLTSNESVVKVLDALAGKLYYTNAGADSNLSGKVQITEGLTAASASKQTGGISFNTSDGQGHYAENTLVPGVSGEVVYGPKETAMMRGAKSAMTTSMLAWRANVTDMTERMGDLRYGTEDGIWARTYGGKIKYDAKNTYFSNSFWGAQVGADKKLASGWHVGGALDYTDGDSDYELGGNGNPKLYTLSAYGTQINDDGSYVDIVLKAGRTENDYTVYNDMGHKLEGDYHTWGTGLSAEYGKRFGDESGYIEPQIQMTLSRLNSADYDAVSDYSSGKKMHVSQDGMTSFIGRVGVAAGRMTERGHFYAKASVLHEFAGDTKSTFSAENEPTSSVKQDFKDTWAELSLGGSYRLSPSSMLYADVTKSFGGDYEVQWKMNAGIRFSF